MALPGEVTNPQALDAREVSFASNGDLLEGYLARPRAAGNYAGLIVVHEIFGVNEHIRDVTRRFANAGFIALAPNLFSRAGKVDLSEMETARAIAFSVTDAQVVRDLEAAAAFLRTQPGATGKVGCIGFCFGGREALLFACNSDKLDAAIDCWGGFLTSATPSEKTTAARPKPVMEMGERLSCPLLAVFGAEDQNPSPADAAELRARLEKAGKNFTVKVFENAGHAFFADYRPQYREAAAFELWRDAIAFLREHLSART
jgi:carboxymethylenebutenolidase